MDTKHGYTPDTTEEHMRAWVGCLACYNEGRLVGEWQDWENLPHYVPCTRPGHDEWQVFDHEGYIGLLSGECSPDTAYRIAEWWHEEVTPGREYLLDAVRAWVDNGDYRLDSDNLPCISDFDDTYQGEWDSGAEFAESTAYECGELSDIPEWIACSVDWNRAWESWLRHDYWTADVREYRSGLYVAPGVFVFRSV